MEFGPRMPLPPLTTTRSAPASRKRVRLALGGKLDAKSYHDRHAPPFPDLDDVHGHEGLRIVLQAVPHGKGRDASCLPFHIGQAHEQGRIVGDGRFVFGPRSGLHEFHACKRKDTVVEEPVGRLEEALHLRPRRVGQRLHAVLVQTRERRSSTDEHRRECAGRDQGILRAHDIGYAPSRRHVQFPHVHEVPVGLGHGLQDLRRHARTPRARQMLVGADMGPNSEQTGVDVVLQVGRKGLGVRRFATRPATRIYTSATR